jgi:hypothetical protein
MQTAVENLNFAEFHLRLLLEAYMYTLYEFAKNERLSMRDAAQVFGGEFGEQVNLFVEALSEAERDLYGGTLAEHLELAAEQTEV